jgi:hypothetical protein
VTKVCTKCPGEKPLEEFYVYNGTPLAACKACIRRSSREQRRRDRDLKVSGHVAAVRKVSPRGRTRFVYHATRKGEITEEVFRAILRSGLLRQGLGE